jgi:vacuole morphology and inheritance protein 14
LLREEDLEFARLMVQSLNLILLTATELHDMRNDLKALASPNTADFFASLYKLTVLCFGFHLLVQFF